MISCNFISSRFISDIFIHHLYNLNSWKGQFREILLNQPIKHITILEWNKAYLTHEHTVLQNAQTDETRLVITNLLFG